MALGLSVLTSGCDVAEPTATVSVYLQSAAAPLVNSAAAQSDKPMQVGALRVRIARLQLHVDPAGGATSRPASDKSYDRDDLWHTGGIGRTLDLSQLGADGEPLLLATVDVPEGQLDQLRLTVDLAGEQSVTVDGKGCKLELAAMPKITTTERAFKVSEPFGALGLFRNLDHEVVLAIDPAQSLIAYQGCWALKPVMRVSALRVSGKSLAVK
jgi:hypothetical protein